MSLFEKKVLLDKDARGGGWGVVQTEETVALDPAKQKAAQERYDANRKVAQAELCELFASPDSSNAERIGSLARLGTFLDEGPPKRSIWNHHAPFRAVAEQPNSAVGHIIRL
jgi:hypothetical protein